MYMLVHYYLCR